MDAIKLLEADHETVEKLFQKFDDSSERETQTRRLIVDQLCHELTIHAAIEEKIFYPAIRRIDEEVGKLVLESFEEHALVKRLVGELEKMDAGDERFEAKTTVLKELVQHHVKEEEDDLFPKVKKALDKKQLEALGEELDQAKERVNKAEAELTDKPPRRSDGSSQTTSG